MEINISENSGTITVTVSVPARLRARDPIVECDHRLAKELLVSKGFNDLKLVSDRATVATNSLDNSSLVGVWVFEQETPDPVPEVKEKPKSSPRRKRASRKTPPSS